MIRLMRVHTYSTVQSAAVHCPKQDMQSPTPECNHHVREKPWHWHVASALRVNARYRCKYQVTLAYVY